MFGITRTPVDLGSVPRNPDWILADGAWKDDGVWDDSQPWIDGDISYETALYINNVAMNGGTVSSNGIDLVNEIFVASDDNGATVNSGWWFGSSVNVSKNLALNLVESKPSLVPSSSLHADSVQTEGMLTLRITGAGQGLITSDSSPLFTNPGSQPYSALLLLSSIGDPVDADPSFYESALVNFDQGGLLRAANGQVIEAGNSQFAYGGTTNGGSGSLRETQMDMQFIWVHFDGAGNWCAYHAAETGGTPIALSGSSIEAAFQLGNTIYQVPGSLSIVGIVRFDGDLNGTQRTDIFNRVWKKARNSLTACLIVGNSVTISGVSDPRKTWPRLVSRWGQFNNVLCIRRAAGAQRLPKFAPVGYALPPGSTTDTDISTMPINVVDYFGANLFINDDQQNMVGGGQPFASWLHCHNSFTTYLQTLNESQVRGIMCTQMAHLPYNFGGDYAFLPYPGFGNSNWRQVSIATRAASQSDFNDVPTSIADVWTAFNLGYDTPDDGNPSDPLNDYANGNPDLFADRVGGGKDAQHPNNAGHIVMFDLYKTAIEDVLAL